MPTSLHNPVERHTGGGRGAVRSRPGRARGRAAASGRATAERRLLARYADRQGRTREVLASGAAAGTVLVVDRDAATRGDGRLVAHLAADEPPENAELVCRIYLHDPRSARPVGRRLTDEDVRSDPFVEERAEGAIDPNAARLVCPGLVDCYYALERLQGHMSIPQLRWCRHEPAGASLRAEPVCLRDVVARLESYEPVCALTRLALVRHREDLELSTAVLGAELARVQGSAIVLNRGLREAVLRAVAGEQLSMSEIATRCGRVKYDRRGNRSGETSWLARRLGLLPEGGQDRPTPWVHSEVLGLIAREGLGISPREVELG